MPMPKGFRFKLTAETRARMSIAQRGRKVSSAHRAKISAALLGRNLSPEHRAKLSAARRGRTLSPETRAKLRRAKSPETRAKMSVPKSPEHRAAIVWANAVDNPEHHVRMSRKYGPNWRKSYTKKRIQKMAATTRGRPPSLAVLAAMAKARAKLPKPPSGEVLQLRLQAKKLKTLTATDLQILRYRTSAPDAKAWVSRQIGRLGRRRPRYTLEQVHGYIEAGFSIRSIADKIRLTERRTRQVVTLVEELDAATPHKGL